MFVTMDEICSDHHHDPEYTYKQGCGSIDKKASDDDWYAGDDMLAMEEIDNYCHDENASDLFPVPSPKQHMLRKGDERKNTSKECNFFIKDRSQ